MADSDGVLPRSDIQASIGEDGKPVFSRNVTEVKFGNLNDVVALLRNAADQVERGELGTIPSGVLVLVDEAGSPIVFGFGKADPIHSIGILHIGAAYLQNNFVIR